VTPCKPMHTFIDKHTTVLTFAEDDSPSPERLESLLSHCGDYDWWYGEISDGVWAIIVTTEDADGNVANPDWQELPVVLKSLVMARLRGEIPA
jgi:hypothetical protein